LEELLPLWYLNGVSIGNFGEALAALLGPKKPDLSVFTTARLQED
jgi:hypothetical protein